MMQIESFNHFAQLLSIPSLGLNWIDILIIVIAGVYMIEGYALGFLRALADFISFVFSFFLALSFYGFFSSFLVTHLSIPKGFASAIGFFLCAFVAELILGLLIRHFVFKMDLFKELDTKLGALKYRVDNLLGIIPGALSAVVLLSFILTLIVALPLSPFLKSSVSASKMGSYLVSNTQGLNKDVNKIFGSLANDALTFLTIEPRSEESIRLNFKTKKWTYDKFSEKEMLALVNSARKKEGREELDLNPQLRTVARRHCVDMVEKGYFSHNSLEGLNPFDRMARSDIVFGYAGENLALAPDVKLAMQGLMQSPGHRKNILSKDFLEVGIGVVDGGIYGKMFCQEFTD